MKTSKTLLFLMLIVVFLPLGLGARSSFATEPPIIDLSSEPINTTAKAPVRFPVNGTRAENVRAAIELIKEFGKPEAHWIKEAENALKWLNDGKIYAVDLPPGTFGKTNSYTGDILLNPDILEPHGGGTFDRNTRDGFNSLLLLAATLIHEKEHVHQSYLYILGSKIKCIVSRQRSDEQDAWSEGLGFLDRVITVLIEQIKNNKAASKETLIQMFWELYEALGRKVFGISDYYLENYGPIAWTRERADQLSKFRNQVKEQINRLKKDKGVDWELFEKLAKDYRGVEAQIKAEAEEWLAGAPQRSAGAKSKVVLVGALEPINGIVAKSIEFGPGHWFSGGKLVSDLFVVKADPIHWDPPAVLIIPFSLEAVINIDKIDVYRFEPSYGRWERLAEGRSVDTDRHTISVNISSLSVYGVFEDPPEDYPPVGYTPSWLIFTAISLMLAGVYLLYRHKREFI
jgi:hypothetical protein